MNKNIESIIKACERQGLEHKSFHTTNNLISVKIKDKNHLFVNWTTPLNPQSIVQLCKDKDYFYSFFKKDIKMPRTTAFLYPYSDDKYSQYLNQKTISEIINQVEKKHKYPLIIKKNSGSWGAMVFKVGNKRELEKSILDIFNINSASYDYVCLSQDFIDIKEEYRVIYLEGKYQFSYKKVIDDAEFIDNLSPLHWEGSKTELVKNKETIKKISHFCSKLFKKLDIPFCGLDVALDTSGVYWLIEANSSPGFDHIIEHEGNSIIVDLYQKIMRLLEEKV